MRRQAKRGAKAYPLGPCSIAAEYYLFYCGFHLYIDVSCGIITVGVFYNMEPNLIFNPQTTKTNTALNLSTMHQIIILKKSQRLQHPERYISVPQKYSKNLLPKHPILGEYASFLDQISGSQDHTTPHSTELTSARFSEESKSVLNRILTEYNLDHADTNKLSQHRTYFMVQTIIYKMQQAIKKIQQDTEKTGGASCKRRASAIIQYKKARADYNLVLSALRGAISSTMRLRRNIQDTTEDQIKYLETTKKTISYQSRIYAADYESLSIILNSDLYYLYQDYKMVLKRTKQVNSLITEYNLALLDTEPNSLRRSLQIAEHIS